MAGPKDRMPKWATDAIGAGLFLFVVSWIVVVFLPTEYRSRFESASQAVGIFGTLGAVSVAVLALRQLDLQRQSIDEQRRAFELERYASLRSEYARWLGVALDVISAMRARIRRPSAMFPAQIKVYEDDARAQEALVSEALASFAKLSLQIGLHDRNEDRRAIRALLDRALRISTDRLEGVLRITTAGRQLRELANKLDPVEAGTLGRLVDDLEELMNAKDESDLERFGIGAIGPKITDLRNAAVYLAQLAVRASFGADEVAAGATVSGANVNEEEGENS